LLRDHRSDVELFIFVTSQAERERERERERLGSCCEEKKHKPVGFSPRRSRSRETDDDDDTIAGGVSPPPPSLHVVDESAGIR